MREIRQLIRMIDVLPGFIQILIAAFLVAFCAVSVYSRINTGFGARLFDRISKDSFNNGMPHVISYTVIPILVTLGYLLILMVK